MVTTFPVIICCRLSENEQEARVLKNKLASVGINTFVIDDDNPDPCRGPIIAALETARVFVAFIARGCTSQDSSEQLLWRERLFKEKHLLVRGLNHICAEQRQVSICMQRYEAAIYISAIQMGGVWRLSQLFALRHRYQLADKWLLLPLP